MLDIMQDDRRARVLLLGAGELSRELVVAFQRLGAEVISADQHAHASASDLDALIAKTRPTYLVVDTDAFPVNVLREVVDSVANQEVTRIVPSLSALRLSLDREGMRKLAADELGLPTAPFWFAGTVAELAAIADHAGLPIVVKPVTGVAGEGQSVLLRAEDVEPAWQRAVAAGGRGTDNPVPAKNVDINVDNRVLAESVVEVDHAVTLLTVRTDETDAALQFCEPIGHRQVGGDALECWQPQEMSAAALDAARSVAARIVLALGGRGVFGVELLISGDEVYFSDVTLRPQDSGLVTLRSQRLSGFELYARAALGLPVDTIMISPAAAEVWYSSQESQGQGLSPGGELVAALAVPESDIRLFDSHDGSGRCRLGVATATAPDVTTARGRVRNITTALRRP
jgi:phosphoribosylglycinamide formyltransferase 2